MTKHRKLEWKSLMLATISLVLVVVIAGYIWVINTNSIILKNSTYYSELGMPVSLYTGRYLSPLTLDKDDVYIDSELIIDPLKYSYDEKTKEVRTRGKDYLEEGVYNITFKRGHTVYTGPKDMTLIVRDTIDPEIISAEGGITIEQYSHANLKDYITIMDADPDLDIKMEGLDRITTLEQGVYTIHVKATDSSHNSASKLISVKVISEAEAEKNPSSLTRKRDGYLDLSQGTRNRVERGEASKELTNQKDSTM